MSAESKRTVIKAKRMSSEKILALPMGENDAGAKTVRGYLVTLLRELWHGEEGFSGKRPFGNSGWKHEVYNALVEGRAVAGVVYVDVEDGVTYREVECTDRPRAEQLICEAIKSL